jgi:carbon monoxide dehydrogenase subunit G
MTLLIALVVLGALASPARPVAFDDAATAPAVTVRLERGVYTVAARFDIPDPPAVAFAVLTDYDAIPRFLSDVKTSVVRERSAGGAIVEQQAVARMLMFSKRVHLVLEITEAPHSIRFIDRCADSFVHYEGSWRLIPRGGGTEIRYALSAQPSFEVPEFMLRRLLKRDADRMIAGLTREMASRPR